MKTTVEALKDLYTKLGGEESQVENINTIPDMIDAIATNDVILADAKISVSGKTLVIE